MRFKEIGFARSGDTDDLEAKHVFLLCLQAACRLKKSQNIKPYVTLVWINDDYMAFLKSSVRNIPERRHRLSLRICRKKPFQGDNGSQMERSPLQRNELSGIWSVQVGGV